ncbi:MAG: acyl carrier protein [Bacteroidota bacterium]
MNRQEIFQKLKAVMTPYIGDTSAFSGIHEGSDLINDLKINSAHIVDIVLDLESEFDIMIDDESINGMVTVGGSIDVVAGKMQVT